jgi:hypothetical protein
MKNLTRRKEIAVAGMIALTTAAVIIAKILGAIIPAIFLAGAGSAITIRYVIIANAVIKQSKSSK